MPPDMDLPNFDHDSLESIEEIPILLTPSTSSSYGSGRESPDSELNFANFTERNFPLIEEAPLEQNLQDLLVQVSNTENLETITQIKLRVISRDLSLQNLNYYMPALRELILDGSIISSLRDLGCGLRNLRVLKINSCGISCIDGVFQFESLEEFYAANNKIEDITPCSFLPFIKILDFSGNNIKDIQSLSYLKLCNKLERLTLLQNCELICLENYKEIVRELLPNLNFLDGQFLSNANNNNTQISESDLIPISTLNNQSERNSLSSGYIISFPPRLSLIGNLINRNRELINQNHTDSAEADNIFENNE